MNNQEENKEPVKPVLIPQNKDTKPQVPLNKPEPTYGPGIDVGHQEINQDHYDVNSLPLSPWAYIGYQVLFSLPLIGLIFALIYGFGDGNINRKNYARAYLILLAVSCVIIILITLIFGIQFTKIINDYIK